MSFGRIFALVATSSLMLPLPGLAQVASPLSPGSTAATPLERSLPPLPAPAASPSQPSSGTGRAATPASGTTSQSQPATHAKPKPKPAAPVREMALPSDPTPALQPETFFTTAKASERYAAIADAGGWPKVPSNLAPGAKGAAVEILRQRLIAEGDLDISLASGEAWGPELTDAVKRFQYRFGLKQTGVVAGKTLKAMNVPASVRFRQLASSAERLAGTEFSFGPRHVVVNIPSAYVEAVEDGRVVRRYVAVVGDVKHKSPLVSTRIVNINLNPTWTVPTSIIRNEIIPKMNRDPGYLARSKIRILDGAGTEIDPASINWSSRQATNYTLRQDSGNGNALGNIRINMPNKDSVYMHDTPSKRFFNSDYRFLSHGCVRVENVFDFAEWLLKDSPGNWSKADMLKVVETQKRQDIRLAQPIPVIWVYMTGWASADGVVHFRDDVYNLDRVTGPQTADAR